MPSGRAPIRNFAAGKYRSRRSTREHSAGIVCRHEPRAEFAPAERAQPAARIARGLWP